MPRPDMRAERIPQIIQAAMAVFARSGFAQTRMEDIAQEAGLAKATLYLYFAGKDEVIEAILQAFFAEGFAELSALNAADGPVSASLIAWTRQRMQELRAHAAFLSIGFEFHAVAARQAATRQALQRYYDRYRAGIAALLQKGIERGELRPGDTAEMALTIMSVYEGLTILWMLDPTSFDLAGVAERSIQSILASMIVR